MTHINPFYIQLQDGTDRLILYSSNVIKLYLEVVCFHCLAGKRLSSFLRGLRQSLQMTTGRYVDYATTQLQSLSNNLSPIILLSMLFSLRY